jgi:hypothetical protein
MRPRNVQKMCGALVSTCLEAVLCGCLLQHAHVIAGSTPGRESASPHTKYTRSELVIHHLYTMEVFFSVLGCRVAQRMHRHQIEGFCPDLHVPLQKI